jgi:hypothetical protein
MELRLNRAAALGGPVRASDQLKVQMVPVSLAMVTLPSEEIKMSLSIPVGSGG